MFAPRVTAAMAADAMLKCCDDADAAAAMLLSVDDVASPPLATASLSVPASAAAGAAAAAPPNIDDKPLCVMCMSNPPSHAFIPCGHKQFCRVCADDETVVRALSQKCPVCRREFQCIVQIFEG